MTRAVIACLLIGSGMAASFLSSAGCQSPRSSDPAIDPASYFSAALPSLLICILRGAITRPGWRLWQAMARQTPSKATTASPRAARRTRHATWPHRGSLGCPWEDGEAGAAPIQPTRGCGPVRIAWSQISQAMHTHQAHAHCVRESGACGYADEDTQVLKGMFQRVGINTPLRHATTATQHRPAVGATYACEGSPRGATAAAFAGTDWRRVEWSSSVLEAPVIEPDDGE